MAKQAWRAYLEQVDDIAPEESVLLATEAFLFDEAQLPSPKAADGITLPKLEAHPAYPKSFTV